MSHVLVITTSLRAKSNSDILTRYLFLPGSSQTTKADSPKDTSRFKKSLIMIHPKKITIDIIAYTYGYYTTYLQIIQGLQHCPCKSFFAEKITVLQRRLVPDYKAAYVPHEQPEPHHQKRNVIKQGFFKKRIRKVRAQEREQARKDIITV